MVVDDLQHLGLVNAVHGLALLVVVHQNDLLFPQVHHVSAGDHAHILALVVQNGEVAETYRGHALGGRLHRGVQVKVEQIFLHHVVADGGGLADHLPGHIGVAGGAEDDAALFLG